MAVSSDDLFAPPAPMHAPHKREPNYRMLSPIVWAPIMYSMRHGLKGRVQPRTQHTLFFAATCLALVHAGTVMFTDSSV